MRTQTIPHPLLCGVMWAVLMLVISLTFLSVKYLWAEVTGAQPLSFLARDQRWSLEMLSVLSFVFGFSIAWIRRRRQCKLADSTALVGVTDNSTTSG